MRRGVSLKLVQMNGLVDRAKFIVGQYIDWSLEHFADGSLQRRL